MQDKPRLLIVEDDPTFREFLVTSLEASYEILEAVTGEACIRMVSARPDVVLLDVNLPPARGRLAGPIGVDLIQPIRALDPLLEIVMMSGTYMDIETAVKAVRQGAYDYVTKDKINIDMERLPTAISNALEQRRLAIENRDLKADLRRRVTLHDIIGDLQDAKRRATLAASTEADVFLQGETGVGKNLFAYAIHNMSSRRNREIVELNCGLLPRQDDNSVRTELFGVVRHYFNHGSPERKGVFLRGDGGTLFLNEISQMPINAQKMLLEAIETKNVERVGEEGNICHIDVRIIYATNVDLELWVKEGEFLPDLLRRIEKAIPISIPPLRERAPEDFPLLVSLFLPRLNTTYQTNIKEVSHEAMTRLKAHEWRGNVRELESVLGHAALEAHLAESDVIRPEHLEGKIRMNRANSTHQDTEPPAHPQIEEGLPTHEDALRRFGVASFKEIPDSSFQRRVFIRSFVTSRGNLARVSEELSIVRATANSHLKDARTEMLTELCKVKANFDELASHWRVPPEDLRYAFTRASRFRRFVEQLTGSDRDWTRAAAKLLVTQQELTAAYQRLKEIG